MGSGLVIALGALLLISVIVVGIALINKFAE